MQVETESKAAFNSCSFASHFAVFCMVIHVLLYAERRFLQSGKTIRMLLYDDGRILYYL